MKNESEKKILAEFIKVIDDPDRAEKKLLRYAKSSMFASFLLLLLCFSSTFDSEKLQYVFALLVFGSGLIFGLSIWFIQAATQTKIMVRHMSKESIEQRINEIDT